MVRVIRTVIRGCGYVEGYGHHPGSVGLLALLVMGFVAGGWVGGLIMLVLFGLPYLVGAYARGKR